MSISKSNNMVGNLDTIKTITNLDLYYGQYSVDTLAYNMNNLSPHSILTTQCALTNEFIWNYILNQKYAVFTTEAPGNNIVFHLR